MLHGNGRRGIRESYIEAETKSRERSKLGEEETSKKCRQKDIRGKEIENNEV